VANAGLIVAIVAIVASVAVLFLLNAFSDRAQRAEPPNPPLARHEQGRLPPEPRLQVQPFQDVAALRAEEQALLTSAAWVDEKAGIARIPIDEAMKIVAEKGLPHWAPAPSPSPAPAAAKPEAPGGKPK